MAEQVYSNYTKFPRKDWKWPDFSPREMACKGDGKLLIHPPSMDKLQALRTKLGVPLIINSAYRSPSYNATLPGAATNSYHMKAMAFDVSMTNHNPEAFERAARECGFTGFGYYPKSNFMHIDTGPERVWGDPFPKTATQLPLEIAIGESDRTSPTQSTTIQAAVVQVASGAGGAVAAVGALEGTAQVVALVMCGLIVLAALWIVRERLKKWAAGVK